MSCAACCVNEQHAQPTGGHHLSTASVELSAQPALEPAIVTLKRHCSGVTARTRAKMWYLPVPTSKFER
jgi:hypothetical protein